MRHRDAAPVRIEDARRIEVDVASPVETIAGIGDREAEAVGEALEADAGAPVAELRHYQPAVDFFAPLILHQQHGLFPVGNAEIAMLHGIDHQLGEAEDDALRIGAEAGKQLREVAGLLQCPEFEFDLHQMLEGPFQRFCTRQRSGQCAIFADGGTDNCAQGFRLVGLGQVVVGTGIETFPHLLGGGGGRLQDDGNRCEALIRLHASEEGHSVEHRHHAVEDDQIVGRTRRFQERPGDFAVFGRVERVACLFAQVFLDDREVERFVVDGKNSGSGHVGSPEAGGARGSTTSKQAPPAG